MTVLYRLEQQPVKDVHNAQNISTKMGPTLTLQVVTNDPSCPPPQRTKIRTVLHDSCLSSGNSIGRGITLDYKAIDLLLVAHDLEIRSLQVSEIDTKNTITSRASSGEREF